MIFGQFELGWETIHKIAVETRRRNNTDFFNPEIQRELGKRPKRQRARYARNTFVVASLRRGFNLYYSETPTSTAFIMFENDNTPLNTESLVKIATFNNVALSL